MPQQTSHSDLK